MNSLLTANMACLEQGIQFLGRLPADLYRRKCADVFGSTIGGHIRHNLDHYLAFADGVGSHRINYDARKRSIDIERDPACAIRTMRQLVGRLAGFAELPTEHRLTICMDDGGDSVWTQTTFGRELQFLLSHTIHHYALVVSLASRFGITEFPDGFGVAPSTLHYREQLTT